MQLSIILKALTMFYHRPEKFNLKLLFHEYKNYRALSHVADIVEKFLLSRDELKHLKLMKKLSLLNVIRRENNRFYIQDTSFKDGMFVINADQLNEHIFYFGTTGRGMSNYMIHQSLLSHSSILRNKNESDSIIHGIEQFKQKGYETLPVLMNDDYEVIALYKKDNIILYIYIPHVDYFVRLDYKNKKLISFDSSLHQSIDIIKNNITFLLMLDRINGDYQNILEQDISASDKMTLAAMFNI